MKKKNLPRLDGSLLILIYDNLEGGNAKEAFETLQSDLEQVARENPGHFFELLRDAAYDRPSAWWFYCGLTNLPKRLSKIELAMHAYEEKASVRKRIKDHFDTYVTKARGREAFKALFSQVWDT